ncbi:hypothetical protein [Sphingomonas sp. TREG-RG-20F-R18-01]|uniref:hypothetical protein n=1 Tax=Sphingomonas sp. TREG-RG-20F-R18-01 TaxID=2914982 RepID=UPI001F58A402|nr:hypothetical protein [Sphingomonas sp. TREG-RG-20F-R18-01]
MKKLAGSALLLALLGGCVSTAATTPMARAPMIPIPAGTGLGQVVGASAASLTHMFGAPIADVREGTARKLQFSNATCVLDTYLYPKGNGEPVVTYLDTRQTDGSPIDRASCVGALQIGRRK